MSIDLQTKPTKENKKDKQKSFAIIVLASILAILCMLIIYTAFPANNPPQTISVSSLKQVLQISDLSTAEYTYNSVATKKTEDGTVKYYVAYKGTVTAGIDFDSIQFEISEDKKLIKIDIPEIKITETSVAPESLDYIFTSDKYETETVSQEAIKLCQADLSEKIKYDFAFFEIATANAESTIMSLFTPLLDSLNEPYNIDIY